MHSFRIRAIALTASLAATASLATASSASAALLGLPLPSPTTTTTTTTTSSLLGSVGGLLPSDGGLVTGTVGTVGGLLGGVTGTVTGTLDTTLGSVLDTSGSGGGLLPTGVVDSLLASLGVAPAGTAGGGTGTGASGTTGDGSVVVDARSPNATFKVLTKLRQIARTGKIKLRVSSDEPGIVAFGGSVRPGQARKARHAARRAATRKPLRIPAAVLAFRKAGALQVTIQLSRSAQRALGRARDARMSLAVVTIDAARNQGKSFLKKHIG
jgi:hypothetical protein